MRAALGFRKLKKSQPQLMNCKQRICQAMSDKISASIVTIIFLLSKDNIKNLDLCRIFQIEILDLCRFRLDFFLDLCNTKPTVAFKVEKTLGRQTALIHVAGAI